ncbi:MAG TPA: uroporphyrinogen-III synthase [Acidimicrobiales bacterium]|nr:uroporphyrinogen-III synthase [Acidimicrobiales bacterium]
MALSPLTGFSVGITADHRWEEQAQLLECRGAAVVHAPTIHTLLLGASDALRDATESLIAEPPDLVLITTGLGVRGWMATAQSQGLDDDLLAALVSAQVLARGPKSAGAALTAGLEIAWSAPSERSTELLEHLGADLAGLRVAVQLDGSETSTLSDAVRARGADVVEVPVYRWTLPDDLRPAERLVVAACEGRLDAVTFTSAPALENLLGVARGLGRLDELVAAAAGPILVVCVGPVCAGVAARHGLTRVVEPPRARLGAMVGALCSALEGRGRRVVVGSRVVVLQGSTAVIDGVAVALTNRERAVLDVLLERPGTVVAKSTLLRQVWGPGEADEHAVEVTVARLRRRLGPAGSAIETAVRRGYRFVADDVEAVTGLRA